MARYWRFVLAVLSLILFQLVVCLVGAWSAFLGVDARGVYLSTLIEQSPGLQRDIFHFVFIVIGLFATIGSATVVCHSLIQNFVKTDRRHHVGLTILWFALGTLFLLLLNAWVAPKSTFSDGWMVAFVQSVPVIWWAVPIGALLAPPFVMGFIGYARLHAKRNRLLRSKVLWAGTSISALMLLLAFSFFSISSVSRAADKAHKPNVIFIGIDSLSLHELKRYRQADKLYAMYSQGVEFDDVVTPLGRTFPSWISIFTGRIPKDTGARFNLTPFDLLKSQRYLPQIFRSAGYQTVYAMDERQFSNLDESFGFDKVIGPAVGASDFILSRISDLPIVNVTAKIPYVGRKLFPFVYANRARRNNYDPVDFDHELAGAIDSIDVDKPLFLAVHFCLPHVPYDWVGSHADDSGSGDFEAEHAEAAGRAAKQVFALMGELKARGVLDNAYVIFLSDHGEGVGSPAAIIATSGNEVAAAEGSAQPAVAVDGVKYGHGLNLLDRDDTDSFLFVQHYRGGRNVLPRAEIDAPVSTIDIAPTLLDLVGLAKKPLGTVDGMSLTGLLDSRTRAQVVAKLNDRPRLMETGLFFSAIGDTVHIDEQSLFQQAAKYYEVSPAGRLQLKADTYGDLIKRKSRAVIIGHWQLTVLPDREGREVAVLSDRRTQQWTLNLTSAWAENAPVKTLIASLKARYPQELAGWSPQLPHTSSQLASAR